MITTDEMLFGLSIFYLCFSINWLSIILLLATIMLMNGLDISDVILFVIMLNMIMTGFVIILLLS